MTHHCNNGIPVDGHHVYGFPSLAPQVSVLRIKLSNLPFIPEDLLSQGIFDLLAPYGIVLEGGIMMDHGWFDGNGYATFQILLEGESSPAALTHELSWQDEHVMYASWSAMPLHCSYCHQPNHSRLDCPVRSAIHCWSCLTTGHIRKHCPQRFTNTNQPSPPFKPNPKSKKPVKNQSPSVPEPQSSKRSLSHPIPNLNLNNPACLVLHPSNNHARTCPAPLRWLWMLNHLRLVAPPLNLRLVPPLIKFLRKHLPMLSQRALRGG